MDIQISKLTHKTVLSYEEQLFNKYVDALNTHEPIEELVEEIDRTFLTKTNTVVFSNPNGETFVIFNGLINGKKRRYTGHIEQFEALMEAGRLV